MREEELVVGLIVADVHSPWAVWLDCDADLGSSFLGSSLESSLVGNSTGKSWGLRIKSPRTRRSEGPGAPDLRGGATHPGGTCHDPRGGCGSWPWANNAALAAWFQNPPTPTATQIV